MTEPRMQVHEVITQFWVGDVVYLRTSQEKQAGMITAVHVRQRNAFYGVTWGDSKTESCHYDFELTAEFIPDFSST